MPQRATAIDVLFVISRHSLLLDIAGPAEAFRLADLHRRAAGMPPCFRLRFCGPSKSLATSVGLAVSELEPLPSHLKKPTWVVLVGQPNSHAGKASGDIPAITHCLSTMLHEALRAREPVHRLVTICSGAVLAAQAGLLTGRRCTTHHDMLGILRALAPSADVVDNRVFVVDGPVASSAGVSAGIDLALHLIAQHCGEGLAAKVAQDMVVYLRRSPRDPELSPFVGRRRHTHGGVHRVQEAISAEPQHEWDMHALAAVARVTERHLLRLFATHAGTSPLEYLRFVRLERARQALEHGASVNQAAEVSGFRTSVNLRRAWQRQWGGSPRDARHA